MPGIIDSNQTVNKFSKIIWYYHILAYICCRFQELPQAHIRQSVYYNIYKGDVSESTR